MVHHVIAYVANETTASTYRALDESEDGPGYTCYGGPGGDSDELAGGVQLVEGTGYAFAAAKSNGAVITWVILVLVATAAR